MLLEPIVGQLTPQTRVGKHNLITTWFSFGPNTNAEYFVNSETALKLALGLTKWWHKRISEKWIVEGIIPFWRSSQIVTEERIALEKSCAKIVAKELLEKVHRVKHSKAVVWITSRAETGDAVGGREVNSLARRRSYLLVVFSPLSFIREDLVGLGDFFEFSLRAKLCLFF